MATGVFLETTCRMSGRNCRTLGPLTTALVVLALLGMARGQYETCEMGGTSTACVSGPQLVMRTANATLTVTPASSTCGLNGVSYFIPIWQKPPSAQQCNDADPSLRHPPSFMADNSSSTYWQSITWPLEDYRQNKPFEVNVTLSFNKTFRFANNFNIFFRSGRPQDMILEKSADFGQTWTALQYYQKNCDKYFQLGVADKVNQSTLTTVICTTRYTEASTFQPGGRVSFELYEDRMKALLGPNQANYAAWYEALNRNGLEQFLTFTDLRFRLLYPYTDGKERELSQFDFYKYYYAIQDIQLEASCFCNLHGSGCTTVGGTPMCQCSHFTTGKDCDRCLPLYNDRPWQPGSYLPSPLGTANECRKCECNDHADSCTYNTTYGRGICDVCKHNTSGNHCQNCAAGFYPNTTLPINDSQRCLNCGCQPLGVANNDTTCLQAATSTSPIGQCSCKPLVIGRQCDTCVPQYYGLLLPEFLGTCQPCNCDLEGTEGESNVCNSDSGQCPCLRSTMGRRCDQCKDGFFNFKRGQVENGCTQCACDAGGAANAVCDKVTGACTCRARITGSTCAQVEADHFLPALDRQPLQPKGGSCPVAGDLWRPEAPLDGLVVATCPTNAPVTVQFEDASANLPQLDFVWPHVPAIRYSYNGTADVTGVILEVKVKEDSRVDISAIETRLNVSGTSATCPNLGANATVISNVTLSPGIAVAWLGSGNDVMLDIRCRYTVQVTVPIQNETGTAVTFDSVLLLPRLQTSSPSKVTAFRVMDLAENPATVEGSYTSCLGQLSALQSREIALSNGCRGLLWSVSAELFNGASVCDCDPQGTLAGTACGQLGGQCVCKPGVGGRRCDRCLPGYFQFSVSGCIACNCSVPGSVTGACDYTSGQCPCRANVATSGQTDVTGNTAGRTCDACVQNFYGFGRAEGCLPCTCQSGSTSQQCAADGQCPCRPTITGRQCDTCLPTYYSFTADGCTSCNCSQAGSTGVSCEQTSGQCPCKGNVQGRTCDTCKAGFFNLQAYNSKGCQPCFCFGHGVSCSSATGFYRTSLDLPFNASTWTAEGDYVNARSPFLGDQHTSYGQKLYLRYVNMAGLNVTGVTMVGLAGDGRVLYHDVASQAAQVNDSVLSVRLLEEFWHNATSTQPVEAMTLLRVLANLSGIQVRRTVGTAFLTLFSVSMETASKNVTATTASFVENCTCTDADKVAGLSCQTCAEGFRRITMATGTSYDSCMACNCTGSNSTATSRCQETTGVCLNCIVGREGDNCERCSANVDEASGCTQCKDGFWGLSREGCKACNCSSPGSTNTVCNKGSGQCACAAHVTGRTCNECEDNYYSLTATGCIQCDQCYGLVMKEVDKVRTLRDNLTATVERLETSNPTATLGSFSSRLQRALNSTQTLMRFVSDASQQESALQTQINGFNASVQQLQDTVERMRTINRPDITSNIMAAEQSVTNGRLAKSRVQENVQSVYSNLNSLNSSLTALVELAASLAQVEAYLTSLSTNSTSGFQRVLQTVATLENVTNQANSLAQTTLQGVEQALQVHLNNTQALTQLEGLDVDLAALSTATIAEGEKVKVKSNATYSLAQTLSAGLSDLTAFNPDLTSQQSRVQAATSTAQRLATQADLDLQNAENVTATLVTSGRNTSALSARALELAGQAGDLKRRATEAETKTTKAKTDSDAIFTAAQNMLSTMQNFSAIAADVERRANASLDTVHSVQNQSDSVIAEAASLSASMALSQQSSAQAKETAITARRLAETKLQELTPVGQSANALVQLIDTEMSNLTQVAAIPASTNASVVTPAADRCVALETSIASLTTKADNANALARNATAAVQRSQARASQILNDLQNIQTVDTTRIRTLAAEITAADASFDETSLNSTVTQLKATVETMRAWLTATKQRRDAIAEKVTYLGNILSHIIPG